MLRTIRSVAVVLFVGLSLVGLQQGVLAGGNFNESGCETANCDYLGLGCYWPGTYLYCHLTDDALCTELCGSRCGYNGPGYLSGGCSEYGFYCACTAAPN
jgi:hypothetical protein